jgi:translation initiation factor 1
MAKKDKIPLEPSGTGLNQPFAGLDGTSLPPGPVQTKKTPEEKVGKRGRVVLRRETANRGGKTVIVVYDIPLTVHNAELETLGRDLRKACGCGGTVRQRMIEIQGDQPTKIRVFLEAKGFRVAGII